MNTYRSKQTREREGESDRETERARDRGRERELNTLHTLTSWIAYKLPGLNMISVVIKFLFQQL